VERVIRAIVDLLAAIPRLIYGLWGRAYLQGKLIGVARFLSVNLGFIPFFKVPEHRYDSSNFIAGVVVSLMVLPIATSVMREVFSQTPPGEKEGALALGATRWGMIRSVVLPFGRGGIIGGSMVGLGRALGETIAVALIISPKFEITKDVLSAGGNSVASLIALRFGEAKEFGLSALMAAGLTLFAVTLIVNMLASIIVSRSRSGKGVEVWRASSSLRRRPVRPRRRRARLARWSAIRDPPRRAPSTHPITGPCSARHCRRCR